MAAETQTETRADADPRRDCQPMPMRRGVQTITIASIERQLKRLAKRHSRLLPLEDNHHGCSSSNNNKNNNNNNGNGKKRKNRKGFLQHRHIESDFHDNYNDHDDETDETNNDNDSDDDDDYWMSRFREFAITVCHAGRIPRKELFEAWAMALYVNHYFPPPPPLLSADASENGNPRENGHRNTYYSRVADLCSGHGLVSWAILFLDHSRQRTAVCIDIRIPRTCDSLEQTMLSRHPDVVLCGPEPETLAAPASDDGNGESKDEPSSADETPAASPDANPDDTPNDDNPAGRHRNRSPRRWHWVEGDICKDVAADASNLLVGVHCCGTLSDTILDLAIQSRSALALVPCCHTRRSLPHPYRHGPRREFDAVLQRNQETNRTRMEAFNNNNNNNNNNGDNDQSRPELLPTTLTDFVDRSRIQKLTDAGFTVKEEYIPSVITPKNRILFATPQPTPPPLLVDDDDDDADDANDTSGNATQKIQNEPAIAAEAEAETPKPSQTNTKKKRRKHKGKNKAPPFSIPLANTPEARAILASQSGRTAALLRKVEPNQYLSLCIYLSDPEASPTERDLEAFANARIDEYSDAHRGKPNAESESGPEYENNTHANSNFSANAKPTARTEPTTEPTNDTEPAAARRVVRTRVTYETDRPYQNPDGRWSRSLGIRYGVHNENKEAAGTLFPHLTKEKAKELHTMVCQEIHEGGIRGIRLKQGFRRKRDRHLDLPPKRDTKTKAKTKPEL